MASLYFIFAPKFCGSNFNAKISLQYLCFFFFLCSSLFFLLWFCHFLSLCFHHFISIPLYHLVFLVKKVCCTINPRHIQLGSDIILEMRYKFCTNYIEAHNDIIYEWLGVSHTLKVEREKAILLKKTPLCPFKPLWISIAVNLHFFGGCAFRVSSIFPCHLSRHTATTLSNS